MFCQVPVSLAGAFEVSSVAVTSQGLPWGGCGRCPRPGCGPGRPERAQPVGAASRCSGHHPKEWKQAKAFDSRQAEQDRPLGEDTGSQHTR